MVGNTATVLQPKLTSRGTINVPGHIQISFVHIPTGTHCGTANENEAHPGLSTVRFHIADYIFKHGTEADKVKAVQMACYSDDNITNELHGRYPNPINATAREYGLSNTHGVSHWGNPTTSNADTVRLLEAKKRGNPSDPVSVAMNIAPPVVADGYRQNYDAATLPGIIDAKWGQSGDHKSIHTSASIGLNLSVVANTYGTKETRTSDAQNAFDDALGISSLPDLSGSPSLLNIPNLPESLNLGELLNLPEAPQLPQIPELPNFTGHAPLQF